jgi:hypothetical protein
MQINENENVRSRLVMIRKSITPFLREFSGHIMLFQRFLSVHDLTEAVHSGQTIKYKLQ